MLFLPTDTDTTEETLPMDFQKIMQMWLVQLKIHRANCAEATKKTPEPHCLLYLEKISLDTWFDRFQVTFQSAWLSHT